MQTGKKSNWRHVLGTTAALTILLGGYATPIVGTATTAVYAADVPAPTSATAAISVSDFINQAKNATLGTTYTITGYIIGSSASATGLNATTKAVASNIALADSPDETNIKENVIPIALQAGSDARTNFNVLDHPELVGTKVTVTVTSGSKGFTYFSTVGIPADATVTVTAGGDTPAVVQPSTPSTPATPTDAAELGNIAIADARKLTDKAQAATITGTVVGVPGSWGGKAFYVQDGTAGIYVYTTTDYKLNDGDKVTLHGHVEVYNGTLEFMPDKATKATELGTVIKGETLDLGDATKTNVNASGQQSLVNLSAVTISDVATYDTYGSVGFTATDKAGKSIYVQLDNRTGSSIDDFSTFYKNGDEVNLTGVLETFKNAPELRLRNLQDIQFMDATKRPAELAAPKLIADIQGAGQTSPYSGKTLRGVTGVVTYLDGTTKLYIQDADKDADQDDSTSNGIMVKVASNKDFKPGDVVSVDGTVKETYEAGYDDKATTDLTVTEIINATATKTGDTKPVPAPVVLDKDRQIPTATFGLAGPGFNTKAYEPDAKKYAIDFWEAVEGMRVEVDNPVAVGPTKNGDTYTLPESKWDEYKFDNKLTKKGGVLLTKNDSHPELIQIESTKSTTFNQGQMISNKVIGVGYYSYGSYKISAQATDLKPVTTKLDVQPETTYIAKDDSKLTVASYNIENFSAATKTPQSQVDKEAAHIVNNLKTPDVINLMEIQDDNGETDDGNVSATKTLQRLVDAIKAAGGPEYKFLNIDPVNNKDGGAPGANIRPAMLYNPARVQLRDGAVAGTTNQAEDITTDGHLKYNPGRILFSGNLGDGTRKPLAAEFTFKGQDVIVVADHLNSKTGDEPTFGKNQPAQQPSEVKRVQLATQINDVLSKAAAAKTNVIMTGDMNDYDFSDAATALEGSSMTDLVKHYDITDRSSYIFDGNEQVLDHVFLSNNLVDSADKSKGDYQFDMVHVNSPFADQASDHDPVLVQVDLAKAADATLSTDTTTPDTPAKGDDTANSNTDATIPDTTTKTDADANVFSAFDKIVAGLNDKIDALSKQVTSLTDKLVGYFKQPQAPKKTPAPKPAPTAKTPTKKVVKPSVKKVVAKRNTKKIAGVTTKGAKVTVYSAQGKKLATTKANTKGKFTLKLKHKITKKAKFKLVIKNTKANGALTLTKAIRATK
ncbi:hypothetical protein EQG49_12005 [Periweissella cryptocerci]|uniref:Uncharacterized protein n=1 Tax=Periweissella cryptocerci TaxID=2506420 RepID=A0A4P6YWF8_9LACO|nr:DUF6359 domain-containing protein [Periweissella cryptocerci]QBO37126.1 hypothetical protein EQG49_12005 [Periweissella cryptocerci]